MALEEVGRVCAPARAFSEFGTRDGSYRTCIFSNAVTIPHVLCEVIDFLVCGIVVAAISREYGIDLNLLLHGFLTVKGFFRVFSDRVLSDLIPSTVTDRLICGVAFATLLSQFHVDLSTCFYSLYAGRCLLGLTGSGRDRVNDRFGPRNFVTLVQVWNGTGQTNFIHSLAAGVQMILALTTVYDSFFLCCDSDANAEGARVVSLKTRDRQKNKKDDNSEGSLPRSTRERLSVVVQVTNRIFQYSVYMLPWLKTLANTPSATAQPQLLSSTPLQSTAPLETSKEDDAFTAPFPDTSAVLETSSPSTDYISVTSEETLGSPRDAWHASQDFEDPDDIVLPTQTSKQKSRRQNKNKSEGKHRNHYSTHPIQMAEPPLTATLAEVEEAYKKAAAEQQRLENEMAVCKSPEFMRKQFACQTAQNTTGRLLMRLTALQGHGELDTRLKDVEARQGTYDENLAKVQGVANQAAAAAACASLKADGVGDAVKFLEAGYQTMRRDVERIDSKQRSKNLVVIGLQRGDPTEAVKKLMGGTDLLRNVDDAFFMSNKPGRRPLLVSFVTKFACEEFLKMSHRPDFTRKFPNVVVVRDRSETRRTGVSRIAASAAKLSALFPEVTIHQHSEFVIVDGKKIDAFEFVASAVMINGTVFDIDEAFETSGTHEVNDYLYARVGDVFVFGYRKQGTEEARADGSELGSDNDEDEEQGTEARIEGGSGRLPRAAKTATANARAASAAPRKRRAAGSNGTTNGGVRIQYGPTEQERRPNLLLMGAVEDPYDRQGATNVR